MKIAEHDAAFLFWRSLTAEPAYPHWTSHQRDIAALLATVMAQLEAEGSSLHAEGVMLQRADGRRRTNPRLSTQGKLLRQALALRRSLGLVRSPGAAR